MKASVGRHGVVAVLLLCAALAAGGIAEASAAGATLDVRLVAADNAPGTRDPRLADILPLLGGNLRFASFSQIAQKNVPFATTPGVVLGKGYTVGFSEPEDSSISVQVTHGKQRLLKTRLRLQPGRPVLVGGFPDEGKTLIIVITLRP